jgi:hypothetical protein
MRFVPKWNWFNTSKEFAQNSLLQDSLTSFANKKTRPYDLPHTLMMLSSAPHGEQRATLLAEPRTKQGLRNLPETLRLSFPVVNSRLRAQTVNSIAVLSRSLKESGTDVNSLFSYMAEEILHKDDIHACESRDLCTFVHSFASAHLDWSASDEKRYERLFSDIASELARRSDLTLANLVHVLWAYATTKRFMGFVGFYESMATKLLKLAQLPKIIILPRQLNTICWVFYEAGESTGVPHPEIFNRFLPYIGRFSHEELQSWNSFDISTIVYSSARAARPPVDLYRLSTGDKSTPVAKHTIAREQMGWDAWAALNDGCQPPAYSCHIALLAETLVGRRDLSQFPLKALANVLCGVAKLKISAPALFQAIGDELVTRSLADCDPNYLTPLLWAFAARQMTHERLFAHVRSHLAHPAVLRALPVERFPKLAWALARHDSNYAPHDNHTETSSSAFSEGVEEIQARPERQEAMVDSKSVPSVARVLQLLADELHRRPGVETQLPPHHLSMLVLAFALHTGLPSKESSRIAFFIYHPLYARLLAHLSATHSQGEIARFQDPTLATLLWSLAIISVSINQPHGTLTDRRPPARVNPELASALGSPLAERGALPAFEIGRVLWALQNLECKNEALFLKLAEDLIRRGLIKHPEVGARCRKTSYCNV